VDTESLMKSLKEHKVKFVIIGATAFPVHGTAVHNILVNLRMLLP